MFADDQSRHYKGTGIIFRLSKDFDSAYYFARLTLQVEEEGRDRSQNVYYHALLHRPSEVTITTIVSSLC
jgi:hypothetical protein